MTCALWDVETGLWQNLISSLWTTSAFNEKPLSSPLKISTNSQILGTLVFIGYESASMAPVVSNVWRMWASTFLCQRDELGGVAHVMFNVTCWQLLWCPWNCTTRSSLFLERALQWSGVLSKEKQSHVMALCLDATVIWKVNKKQWRMPNVRILCHCCVTLWAPFPKIVFKGSY